MGTSRPVVAPRILGCAASLFLLNACASEEVAWQQVNDDDDTLDVAVRDDVADTADLPAEMPRVTLGTDALVLGEGSLDRAVVAPGEPLRISAAIASEHVADVSRVSVTLQSASYDDESIELVRGTAFVGEWHGTVYAAGDAPRTDTITFQLWTPTED
jgi:hypothetical protein